jgi:hypothetical protein
MSFSIHTCTDIHQIFEVVTNAFTFSTAHKHISIVLDHTKNILAPLLSYKTCFQQYVRGMFPFEGV